MTKTIYLTLGGSLIVSLIFLGKQQLSISELRSQNESLKISHRDLTSSSNRKPPHSQSLNPERSEESTAILRQHLIDQSDGRLKKIAEQSGRLSIDLVAGSHATSQILEAVSHLNTEELFTLYHTRTLAEGQSFNDKLFTSIIGAILAESDPHRILENREQLTSYLGRIRLNAFHALLTKNPATAKKWYAENVAHLSTKEKENLDRVMCKSLMLSNLNEYIEFLATMPPSNWNGVTIGGIEMLNMNSSERTTLIQTLEKKNLPKLNASFAAALYRGALMSQDKTMFEEVLSGITLSPEKKLSLLSYATDRALDFPGADQKKVTEFLKETIPLENKAQIMKQAMISWGKRETVAAGEWLAEQESSEAIDGAIAGYAQTVYSVDPEASMAWLEKISNPVRKKTEIQNILSSGPEKNPPLIIKIHKIE